MNILFIGDIVGKPGRKAIANILPQLRAKHDISLVIANGENLSHGRGISLEHYEAMRNCGVDWFTTGNHVWARSEILPHLDDKSIHILRPANYGSAAPGRGAVTFEHAGKTIQIINLQGRVFMPEATDNPFTVFDASIDDDADIVLVDFHAEATSEKWAFGHYATGRATAVVGTHTHVPTADERILDGRTAFISDLGMCGTVDSIIGCEKGTIINHFLTGMPWRYQVAEEGHAWFNGALVTIDEKTNRATSIERIQQIYES